LGISGFLASMPAHAETDTLYFAPLPMEQPETVVKQFKPLLNYLEQKLGVTIVIRYSSSYNEILERFRTGQIDLAYLGPLPYVTLRENFPEAEPLVHFLESNGEPSYTCALISAGAGLPQAGIKKTFALTQPLSTCGYLTTDSLLRQQRTSLSKQSFRYLHKHDEVAQAVARGDYDYGGLKTSIARNYRHLGIRILAESPALPSFALIANARRVPPERIAQIRKLLTSLEPREGDRVLMQDWGKQLRHGAVPAKDTDYLTIRKMHQNTSIPTEDNF
jgi:phosphonate transport system substrate-binding protein